MKQKAINLDYNATTPISPEVKKAWIKSIDINGNPSSLHQLGQEAKNNIEDSRTSIADILKISPEQLIFTSSATEANNMVIKTCLNQLRNSEPIHIISSMMEHSSVRESCRFLERCGVNVTWLTTDESGILSPNQIESAITADTKLITLMLANNETGVIQPVKDVAALAKQHGITILTDAVQSIGKMPLSIPDLDVDFLSLCGHKIYAPKGIGLLYVRNEKMVDQLLHGGGHERQLRAGTENVSGIVALAQAFKDVQEHGEKDASRLASLKSDTLKRLKEQFPNIQFNGSLDHSLCNTINFSLPGVEGHALAINLDLEGIAVSTGSACSTGSVEPSPVLQAMGLDKERTLGAIRLSFGRYTTKEELDIFIEKLQTIVARMTM